MDVTARARRSAISALEWSGWWHLQSDEERDAELAHYLATPRVQAVAVRQDPLSRVARVRRIQASWALTATLPAVTARCSVCRLPNNADEAPCGECRRVLAHHGPALDSLEFITAGTVGGLSYEAIAGWKKDEHAQRQRRRWDDGALDDVAVALSAYLEHHAQRLCADGALFTTVPTAAPVISVALDRAAVNGWFHTRDVESGTKRGDWRQKRDHRPREVSDWNVVAPTVAGRRVLLFDDFLVTGESLFSYATALRQAGAQEVRAVVFQRIARASYREALGRLRREGLHKELTWRPDRAEVAVLRPNA